VPTSFAAPTVSSSAKPLRCDTLVACPDARPPAYQAVVGLARAGRLGRFLTAYYYRSGGPLSRVVARIAPARFSQFERRLLRRHDPEIPAPRVMSSASFDVALAVENRLGATRPRVRHQVARWRTRTFDRKLARALNHERPRAALIFSDVGSEFALPMCRELGIRSILSVVHGDVREERRVLEAELERSPDFFPIYLPDGPIDRKELAWLHERRLQDIELADRILVPSDHLAEALGREGTPRDRIRVVPYAADAQRFRPDSQKRFDASCIFLFAGGITQRKGIKYLLEAWRKVRRPGWKLQLLGALPNDSSPLHRHLDDVELLGRVSHSEVPARMAAADVFVFPSLFEGSAVVTYEALASGLPAIVTPTAGSVVRDGTDGFLVAPADVEGLAARMEQLGKDPALRELLSKSARSRAEAFDWPRYHIAVVDAVSDPLDAPRPLTRAIPTKEPRQ
jgi:alpha-maltose-1-phosphate synthase